MPTWVPHACNSWNDPRDCWGIDLSKWGSVSWVRSLRHGQWLRCLSGARKTSTLQGTNISPKNGSLKMIFLFPRWDMLIPWRVHILDIYFWHLLTPWKFLVKEIKHWRSFPFCTTDAAKSRANRESLGLAPPQQHKQLDISSRRLRQGLIGDVSFAFN